VKIDLLIAYLSIGSVLIPLTIAVIHWKKMAAELKPLCWILLVSLTCDMLSFLLIELKLNTLLVVNIYLFAQFSFLIWLFKIQLKRKYVLNFTYLFFVIFFIVNICFFQGPWVFNSFSNVVACLILICLTLYYFSRLLNDLPTFYIYQLPMLWISFAVLLYYAGNFFLFLISNYLVLKAEESHRMLWILHNLLNIIKNILFAVALWQSYRKVKSYTLSSSAP